MIMPMLMFYVDADDKAHDDDETYDNMVLRMIRIYEVKHIKTIKSMLMSMTWKRLVPMIMKKRRW